VAHRPLNNPTGPVDPAGPVSNPERKPNIMAQIDNGHIYGGPIDDDDRDPFEQARLQAAEDPGDRVAADRIDDAGAVLREQRRLNREGVPDFRGPGDLADATRYADEQHERDLAAVRGEVDWATADELLERTGGRIVDAGPVELRPTTPAADRHILDGNPLVEDITPPAAGPITNGLQVGDTIVIELPDERIAGRITAVDDDGGFTFAPASTPNPVVTGPDEPRHVLIGGGSAATALDDTGIDPTTAAAVILAQTVDRLERLATNRGRMNVVALQRQIAATADAIRSGIYPQGKLVTADVLLRTDGQQFEARIDGGVVPWPLYIGKPITVDSLTDGLNVVYLPIIAHRVLLVDERGVQAGPVMPGEPDADGAVDVGALAAEQARKEGKR
jgi:hypothetical protein